MTLATVTGTLGDFGGGLDASTAPRILFTPNGTAVGSDGLHFARPVIVDDFGPGGTWSVVLESTDALWRVTEGDVFYVISIERLISGADYFPYDLPGWTLRVPPQGGEFASLVGAPSNPAQIWFGPEPPLDPTLYTGWYDTDALPGEPNYFEWE